MFRYDANVSEKLRGLEVQGSDIWISGDYIVSSIAVSGGGKKPTEKHYYLSNDKINYMSVGHIAGELVNNPILCCQDKLLRVLNGDEMLYSVALAAPASVITYMDKDMYIYGCSDGSIGLVQLGREKGAGKWAVPTRSKSAVTAIRVCDFSSVRPQFPKIEQKGQPSDLVVGRDDGSLELYRLRGAEELPAESSGSSSTKESITGLDVGPIRDPSIDLGFEPWG